MNILFIQPYPVEGPSCRYRVEQYIAYFESRGIRCRVRPFVSSKFYRIIYKKGFYIKKALYFIEGTIKRFFDIFTAVNSDIVFIHLEAYPLGPPLFERIISMAGKKIIYDFDDAIYMKFASDANSFIRYLRCPFKIKKIIKMSKRVITCNAYLADYAKKYNKNVFVIHTSVDTRKFTPRIKAGSNEITIGWIGSHSTAKYLEDLKDVFSILGEKYKFNLKIIGAGRPYQIGPAGIKVINLEWKLEDEIGEFQSLDIGVYPLPEDEWVLGKTGFKTIQYMSVGVPCVVSNVGANKDIVNHGINGYLAGTQEEWIEKLSMLIQNPELRERIGREGRRTAEERFSLERNLPKYLEIIESLRTN